MVFIKGVYVIALAAFVAMFVGFGILAFYPEPEVPSYPDRAKPVPREPPPATPSPASEEYQRQQEELQQEYEVQHQAYEKKRESYLRNVFIIASVAGLAFAIGGLLLGARLDVIRAGLVLGGTVTVIYGVTRYFGDMSNPLRFGVVTVGLGLLIYLGYRLLSERRAPTKA